MLTLGIDCATEACSVALFDDGELVDHRFEKLGRGHAERLIPMISQLPDKGKAADIRVALGPGSFTGIRIGLAAARALGLAWGAQVAGYPTLALVAAQAQSKHPAQPVTVCMKGGHGEAFVQDFTAEGLPQGALHAIPLAELAAWPCHPIIAGNMAPAHPASLRASLLDDHKYLDILPDARNIPTVPRSLFSLDLRPVYGRPPDARPTRPHLPDQRP